MKLKYLGWFAAGSVLLGACVPGLTPTASPSPDAMMEEGMMEESTSMTTEIVLLSEQNDSGQSGTATLVEDADGNVVVTLSMTGGEFTEPQPAHIHVGSCPNPGAVQYPLNNVMDGTSETVLDVTMDELLASSDYLAINVHKSAAEASVYTACGDLK